MNATKKGKAYAERQDGNTYRGQSHTWLIGTPGK